MYQLYSFAHGNRSLKVRCLLEELNLKYEMKMIDGDNEEFYSDEYLQNIYPAGLVPVLFDDNKRIFEAGAILSCCFI